MNNTEIKTMRDTLIEAIYKRMGEDTSIFFVSADMGAPALDRLRKDFKDRFVNVGIAEQNLVNVSTGLALEGFTVYAYAIATFFMRAYEQIRLNLALSSQIKEINVNLIGVGVGVSYDVSGPTHHCLEDLTIMRALPNIILFSPSDWLTTEKFLDFSIGVKRPKYIRLDGKPLPRIYDKNIDFKWKEGFYELLKGDDIAIVSTGYMTHQALKVAKELRENRKNIGVIDIYLLNPVNEDSLFNAIKRYKCIITLEEAFTNRGGLDSLIMGLLNNRNSDIRLKGLGFLDKYVFRSGKRDFLHSLHCFGRADIIKIIKECERFI